jgi:hypothetical protein
MKSYLAVNKILGALFLGMLLNLAPSTLMAQDEEEESQATTLRPVKNTFESTWLIDNQSVMIPVKGTLQMDIMHRFGTVNNGYDDFFGLYAPSNIRMGMSYVPVENLNVGFGFTKFNMTWDFNAKYAILKQMRENGSPVSITYFGNMAWNTRRDLEIINSTDRLSYFHQLIFARKFTDKFSVQVAPSLSHFNSVKGYVDSEGLLQGEMENDHIAVSFSGRYKITPGTVILVNYDQPITKHTTNNPEPNIALGIEFNTSAHAFQVFVSNYSYIVPQYNNMLNQNDYRDMQFLIGFNITRLWNF